MKPILFYFLIGALFTACIDDVEDVETRFPQQWQLVRMTGQDDGADKTDDRLQWQEFYLLNLNGEVLKSRLEKGVKTTITGQFTFQESEEETLLILTYDEPSDIIGSCVPELTETLRLLDSSRLIGTWSACDGPGLEYRRIR